MKLIAHLRDFGKDYWFWCPGCEEIHTFDVRTDGKHPSWTFNGNMEKPTFNPSLLYPGRCHLFLIDGVLRFCLDCKHDLKSKNVELPELPEWIK